MIIGSRWQINRTAHSTSPKPGGAAKTVHGRETRAIRAKRQQALAELKLIERVGRGLGLC